ncbi:MAG: DHH family phosphoesterase [Oscillospiraceae bacterium]|jgi:phosphoesterase RecJ-like protein|nr:DHH family phosphoesterase [Oscillospiraceae bacterium]
MTVNECAEWLRARDNFLIITHRRPDGDTIGSAAALAGALRAAGKMAHALRNGETTARYLPLIEPFHAPDSFEPGHIIAVDTASREMFPGAASGIERVDLSIDHHPSNTLYAEETLCDPSRASCGELVFDVISRLGEVSRDMAEALYIAVSTDTGCFSYDNTNAGAFLAASRLAELGADTAGINKRFFRSRSRSRVAIEGFIYSGLEFLFGGKAAVAVITNEMMKRSGADEDDIENIAALPVSIEGVLAGVTIREMKGGGCKVSVRSSPGLSSNEICARFGGGGHAAAAGFTSDEAPESLKPKIAAVLKELFER